MRRVLRIIWFCIGWGLASTALGATRTALVIGNSAYAERPLRNPVNDAADVATAFGKLGFEVISERNLDRRGMHKALQAFREKLRGGQLGIFFYAGHGAQYQNRTYLIPIDANINDAADLPIEALEASGVLAQMQSAGNAVSVVILDACRNLPYPGADRAGERGLARLDAIRGSLVAYATSPGQVAQDGEGRNSPYTAALLAELAKPGQSLTDLFNNVGWTVASSTQNKQEPWYSTSPLPKITLAQWTDQTPPSPPVVAVPTPSPQPALASAPMVAPTRQVGEIFRDALSDGGEGPLLVVIGPGSFQMGSPEGEVGRYSDERRHSVTIEKAFALGQHEVTVGEFRRFVEATGYRTDAEKNAEGKEGCFIAYREGSNWTYGYRSGSSWKDPNFQQESDHPVVCVSWADAVAYTAWLSEETGKRYRLPTEAEWEYAARAGTGSARYWGEDSNQACRYANVADRTAKGTFSGWTIHECTDNHVYTAVVGSYSANAWKLQDMLGNVWEWTCSLYTETYDGSEHKCTTKDTVGPRAVRGGAWLYEPAGVRSAARDWVEPAYRIYLQGFRLARSL